MINLQPLKEVSSAYPLVSIGIPTYNRSAYIRKSIESVLIQDYPNLEIIISDNASTDETEQICEEYSRQNQQIKYIRQPQNLGSFPNFRVVLQQASGEYFMWLGDDDWIDSNYISQCVQVLQDNPDYALVSGRARYILADDSLLYDGLRMNLLQDSPIERVITYYSQVTDNGSFYGVMRRAQLAQIPVHKTMGGDWLLIGAIAFFGKVKTLENITVNRLHKNPNELGNAYKKGAASDNLPQIQGEYPHLSIAISAYNDVAYFSPVYQSLTNEERQNLALEVQKAICQNYGVQLSDRLFQLLNALDRVTKDPENLEAQSQFTKIQQQIENSSEHQLGTQLMSLYQTPYPPELPIHFFTIVLNGEPFIRYHIEVFRQLPFKWHWHIVEGVAELKHDTAWSLKRGGQVTDEIHRNGRSKDGTSEYLDELAQTYPDNVTIYRKPIDIFWDGKREMVNAPLPNILEECLLWQVDVDELWTIEQICKGRQLFLEHPDKTAAFYWCWYFVGEKLIISTRNCYTQHPQQDWLRTWRFKPGYKWAAHEPPVLTEPIESEQWRNVADINPFLHDEMEVEGLVFQHFAYILPEQLRFKEQYYGYQNALAQWQNLQTVERFPVLLREYFAWVRDDTMVDRAEACGIIPIAQKDRNQNWQFIQPSEEFAIQRQRVKPIIVIDGVFFQLYQTGIARVWRSLLSEWATGDFANHIIVLDRVGSAPKMSGIRYRPIPAYDYSDTDADRAMLQQVCDEEGADLFISTYYSTPLSTPSVFMAYDMIPEVMNWDLSNPMWREKHIAIQQASAYISISKNTARDLLKFFPEIPETSVTVAHCGVASNFYPASIEEVNYFITKYGIAKPYFLLSGLSGGYKNTTLFFQAFSQLATNRGFEIVCTGSGGLLPEEFRAYTPGITVHMLQLNDDELRAAYSGAVALVYPSKYEGFGLPVLEALSCGCPVITTPNASIPEVAHEAAIYVEDDNVTGLANTLCEVQKPSIRHSLSLSGVKQSQKFSWKKMADIVQNTLLTASLQSFNLSEINLIIFPNWSSSEEDLAENLKQVLRTLMIHPDRSRMTLLVETTGVSLEDADSAISSIVFNLLMEEELEIEKGPEISILEPLSQMQWQTLQQRIDARIILENENLEAISSEITSSLPSLDLHSLVTKSIESLSEPSLQSTDNLAPQLPQLALQARNLSISDAIVSLQNSSSVFIGENSFLGDNLISLFKSLSFARDVEFIQAVDTAVNQLNDPNHHWKGIIWRTYTLAWSAKHCLNVEGDFVELGVYQGYNSLVIAHYLDFNTVSKNWFLYDTFEGVPEDQANQKRNLYAESEYREMGLYESVVERFQPFSNINVVRGRVPEILEEVCPEKISFLHIDMNSALAELSGLEKLFDKISPGGIIVFDDYGWSAYAEQKIVEDEFMKERGYLIMELPTGQGFVIKR